MAMSIRPRPRQKCGSTSRHFFSHSLNISRDWRQNDTHREAQALHSRSPSAKDWQNSSRWSHMMRNNSDFIASQDVFFSHVKFACFRKKWLNNLFIGYFCLGCCCLSCIWISGSVNLAKPHRAAEMCIRRKYCWNLWPWHVNVLTRLFSKSSRMKVMALVLMPMKRLMQDRDT